MYNGAIKSMYKPIIFAGVFVVLFTISTIPNSYGLNDYELISEWGSFGISKPGHFSHPQFLTVDDEGNVYITDLGNKRVQKLSSHGEFVTEWGSSGKNQGEFHYPSGITSDKQYVYVSDRELNRVQKFDHSGNFVLEWGSKGVYDGQFLFPNGLVASNDFVYVVDTGNHRIQKFTTNGDFILSFGSSGTGQGQFITAIGIDADDEGNLYVTDKGNGKIEKFDSNGNHIASFKYYGSNYIFSPEGITVDPDGKLIVINSANKRILQLSDDSFYLDIFAQRGPYPDVFKLPNDLAIGINGELIVIDSASHVIQTFETSYFVTPKTIKSIIDEPLINTPDFKKPTIIAPPDMVIDASGPLTFVELGKPIASDESGIKTILNNAPDGLPLGVTTIMWIAFDNQGNSAHSFQVVTVNVCGKSYSEYNRIYGTDEDDIIQGTNLDDLIFALDGNDLIDAGNGDDCVFGGTGDDIIYGGNGHDTVNGNHGNDILKGFSGDDVLYGNEGQDVIDGGEGFDICSLQANEITINCES